MFKVSVVEECPHTKVVGQLRLPHYIIAALAGAVQDKEEWMAMLCGTRSEDGLVTTVTKFKVPDHYRSHGSVELMRKEPLTADIVGVVHSHHTFGAFFSHTDKTELNTRFPVSIVVAQPRRSSTDECYSLGFDYQAEGKVTLPCGSVGQIDFLVVPEPLPMNWKPVAPVNFDTPQVDVGMGDCDSFTSKRTRVHEELKTECGLAYTRALPSIFGTKDNLIMPQVLKRSKPTPTRVWLGSNHAGQPGRWQDRGEQLPLSLRGWNDAGPDKRSGSDQWGYWGVDGKYHRYDDGFGFNDW